MEKDSVLFFLSMMAWSGLMIVAYRLRKSVLREVVKCHADLDRVQKICPIDGRKETR